MSHCRGGGCPSTDPASGACCLPGLSIVPGFLCCLCSAFPRRRGRGRHRRALALWHGCAGGAAVRCLGVCSRRLTAPCAPVVFGRRPVAEAKTGDGLSGPHRFTLRLKPLTCLGHANIHPSRLGASFSAAGRRELNASPASIPARIIPPPPEISRDIRTRNTGRALVPGPGRKGKNKRGKSYIRRPRESQADVRDAAGMVLIPELAKTSASLTWVSTLRGSCRGRLSGDLPNTKTRVWLAILFRKSRLVLPPAGHPPSQGLERSLLSVIPYSSGTSPWELTRWRSSGTPTQSHGWPS